MRLIAALFCSLFLFAACSADAASKLAGKYTVQMEMDTSGMPAEMADMLKKSLEKPGECEVNADGTWKTVMPSPQGEQSASGTWKLDGDKIEMTATDENGEKSQTMPVAKGTVAGDKITLVMEQAGAKVTLNMTKK